MISFAFLMLMLYKKELIINILILLFLMMQNIHRFKLFKILVDVLEFMKINLNLKYIFPSKYHKKNLNFFKLIKN
jgi:hypothetical protein